MSTELQFRSPAGVQHVRLDGPTVVGREAGCDVVIDSVRLSRRHAEFVPTAAGVEVRDLESRNGILLNGERVEVGLLGPGDRVVMGDVSVTLRQGGTVTPARPRAPEVPAVAESDPDATSLLRPSFDQPPARARAAMVSDRTTVLPAGGLPGAAPLPAAGAPEASQRTPSSMASRTAGLLTFSGRLSILLVALAAAVFAVTALPILLSQGQTLEATAEARVATLARLLASENARLLTGSGRLAARLGSVADIGGVRSALVLGPDGRVLAPTEQLDEVITDLPGFGDVRDVRGVRVVRVEGMYEAVASIEDGARRLGVAWVRFDPFQAAGGRGASGLLLLTSLLFAGVLGLGGAFIVRRMVTSRLEGFGVDVELAIGQQGEMAGSRHALPGLPKVAEAIDYLLESLAARTPHGDVNRAGQAKSPHTVPRAPLAAPPERRPAVAEGSLTLDSAFVVRAADPRALELIGCGGQIAGIHLLEAVPDQMLVTAVIDCIAALDRGTSASHAFEVEAGAGVRGIEASRTGDGLIRIAIRGA